MEDQKTILELYQTFVDKIYVQTVEKNNICEKISEQQDKLNPTLTKEQLEILRTINELENEKNELVYKNVFVFAYQLATKSLLEGLGIKIDNIDKNNKKE